MAETLGFGKKVMLFKNSKTSSKAVYFKENIVDRNFPIQNDMKCTDKIINNICNDALDRCFLIR